MSAHAVLFTAKLKMRPPLKWAGGKTWLLPHLEKIWRAHNGARLVEPFCGGLAIALGLRPERALLNDANPHLINFYRQLQHGLILAIEMRNDAEIFYRQRTRFNELIETNEAHTPEAAALFYYLNRTCFNGLCRFNARGLFNVPFGKYKTINYATDFEMYRNAFQSWAFTRGDFADLQIAPDDFIYADPPYDVEFTSYSAGGFDWHDQVRTAEWLSRFSNPVVLSNQATARIVELYDALGFRLQFFDAPRRINSNGDRTPAPEVLASKNL